QGAPVDGGFLPNAVVTDLDLAIGNYNSAGQPIQNTRPNLLVATTYGRGTFAIRPDQSVPPGVGTSGPRGTSGVVNQPPSSGNAASIDVTFSGPVDPVTFTAADVLLKDPLGNVLTVQVTDVSGGVPNQHSIYQISFNATKTGNYPLRIGPNITDFAGQPMNQNQNGINGEPFVNPQNPGDAYQNTLTFTVNQAPTISSIGLQNTTMNTPVGPINFTVGDAETPAGSLFVSATSSNQLVLPNGNIS